MEEGDQMSMDSSPSRSGTKKVRLSDTHLTIVDESLRRSPITDEDCDNFLTPRKSFFDPLENGGVGEVVEGYQKNGVMEDDPEINREVEEEGDGDAGVVHAGGVDATNNRNVESISERGKKEEGMYSSPSRSRSKKRRLSADTHLTTVDESLRRSPITDEDCDNFLRSDTPRKSFFDRLENGGVGEVVEGYQKNGVMEDDPDGGVDAANNRNVEDGIDHIGDDGVTENVSKNQQVQEGGGDDVTNIRNHVEDGHARSEEVEVGGMIEYEYYFKVDTDERKGEKVEDGHTNPKEFVANDDHEMPLIDDDEMKKEEINIYGRADTNGQGVDFDDDSSTKDLERDDKIDKETQVGDITSSKEDTSFDQKTEESGPNNDMEEGVAEDDDVTNNKKMDQDGADIHRMSEPIHFCDDEPPLAHPMSHADLDILSIETFTECSAVASGESISEFSVIGRITPSPKPGHGPIDIVAVVDVSLSMKGLKFDLVKTALLFFIDNFNQYYRLSIISFSSFAERLFPFCQMNKSGRIKAKSFVSSMSAAGGYTNLVEGLKKAARVLEERLCSDPICRILLFSDGKDTCYSSAHYPCPGGQSWEYLEFIHLLPRCICPLGNERHTIPLHALCFGQDADQLPMQVISRASGGKLHVINCYEHIEAAFGSCTSDLVDLVVGELEILLKSAANGVLIKSISSKYWSEISDDRLTGIIHIGNFQVGMTWDHEEFVVNISLPVFAGAANQYGHVLMDLLDVRSSYIDLMSNDMGQIDHNRVMILRPVDPAPDDVELESMYFDNRRNILSGLQAMQEAEEMTKQGDFGGACRRLTNAISTIHASPSWEVGLITQQTSALEKHMTTMEQLMSNGWYQPNTTHFLVWNYPS